MLLDSQNHGSIVNAANSEDLLAVSSEPIVVFTVIYSPSGQRAYRRVHTESSLAE